MLLALLLLSQAGYFKISSGIQEVTTFHQSPSPPMAAVLDEPLSQFYLEWVVSELE